MINEERVPINITKYHIFNGAAVVNLKDVLVHSLLPAGSVTFTNHVYDVSKEGFEIEIEYSPLPTPVALAPPISG